MAHGCPFTPPDTVDDDRRTGEGVFVGHPDTHFIRRAEEGLLVSRGGLDSRADLVPNLETVDVPGGHHCHLDGEVTPVAEAINRFLLHD